MGGMSIYQFNLITGKQVVQDPGQVYLGSRKGKVPGLDVLGRQVNTSALGTPGLGSALC